ncbi:nuclear transport factor 2 family protein [Chitinophaga arvensicola]|uniref:Predicted SnoaL-like aldol condensation-catalyzing enzyme n=1 Tax=Chitinophaga arvensicola TaxID=29529 RepID=A0A1I0S9S5_9BACT|nr:nuclear transport factor 2 family protein [Chitinophaga arvensicola]SEW52935.1 Predicted SnoaL-like aldol condensation-catalyzing enzyme [Chitinophaga arvensicola]
MSSISNKAIVLAAFKHLIGERNTDVIDTYLHDHYRQHSPMVKDGKAGLLEALAYLKQQPLPAERKSPVVRTLADGDFVMLHMDVAFMGKSVAVVDLYRLEEGKLAEHWDATEAQPEYTGTVTMTNGASEITDLEYTATNKLLVEHFFRSPDNAFLAPDYLSHTPGASGLEHLPVQIHRVLGEGNFVLVQSTKEGSVYYDICRLQDGLLAEHWRVTQVIPATMPHRNGMI